MSLDSSTKVRRSKSVQFESPPRIAQSVNVTKSDVSVASRAHKYEELSAKLDQLEFKILGLWLSQDDPPYHAVRVTFSDQLLISAVIKPHGLAELNMTRGKDNVFAKGILNYDPSDYEKMCLFADNPLIVNIQALKSLESAASIPLNTPDEVLTPTKPATSSMKSEKKDSPQKGGGKGGKVTTSSYHPQPPTAVLRPTRSPENINDISSCNVDILPLFLDQDDMCVKKRLQPMRRRSYMMRQSWDNLPLLTMSVTAIRHPDNARHHRLLCNANWMKFTVVGAYNLLTPYNYDCYYTAATKIPMYNEAETEMTMYAEGISVPRKFNSTSFYPRWESLRLQGEPFSKGDDKLKWDIEDIHNPDNIDLEYYLKRSLDCYKVIWGSFRRTLVLGSAEQRLWEHLRQWKWPLEVHYYGDVVGGFSFMGFMDLFQLLYPGDDIVNLNERQFKTRIKSTLCGVRSLIVAVPLHWFSAEMMTVECNSGVLLMPNEKLVVTPLSVKHKQSDSAPTSTTEDDPYNRGTGADEKPAFVLVEVQFGHPMVPEEIPPYIPRSELMQMLAKLQPERGKRACRSRGQQSSNWQATVRSAKHALRRVPHHGLLDICLFNRQLSDSRTHAELLTSFWLDASLYVNNNFVITQFLESEETYQEMLLMAHVALMKSAAETLSGKDDWQKVNPALRAARHARQVNDIRHAAELYMQAVVQCPSDEDYWRELSTCLKDVDWEWACVCLNKSLSLTVRHPLTILSKACMVFEESIDSAEPFFTSLLNLYPLWPTAYIVAIAYCHTKEYFRLAGVIKECLQSIRQERLIQEPPFPRAWERELGDFWEPTYLLPGMSHYYEVADLLLRIRAIRMAEVCLGLALAEHGETAAYYHLVSVCTRLKGDVPSALCLVHKGIELFGQDASFRCLEGECYHQLEDTEKSIEAFAKAKGAANAHSVLLSLPSWEPRQVRVVLVDLLHRHPSAYAWMALANDWIVRAEMEEELAGGEPQKPDATPPMMCAEACAVQALKWDRRAGRAWALLAKLVKPQKRSTFCANMAINCGFTWVEETDIRDLKHHSQVAACHLLATSLKDCRCHMCNLLQF